MNEEINNNSNNSNSNNANAPESVENVEQSNTSSVNDEGDDIVMAGVQEEEEEQAPAEAAAAAVGENTENAEPPEANDENSIAASSDFHGFEENEENDEDEEGDAADADADAEDAEADDDDVEEDEAEEADEEEEDDEGGAAQARPDEPEFIGNEEEVETEQLLDNKDMNEVLQIWDSKRTQASFDPSPILRRLAEIFERETDIYMRKDPDPLDERHPYRSDPSCQFGFLLKTLFRKDIFMNKLVNDYLRDTYFTRQNIQKSALELNILACRLILVILPGLDTSAVFQVGSESLLQRIYGWAEDSIEPLQSYAAGLLAAAMEVADMAVTFREANTRLVPKMIKRLHMMQAMYKSTKEAQTRSAPPSADNSFNTSDCAGGGGGGSGSGGGGGGGLQRILPNWMAGDSAPQSPDRQDEPVSNALGQSNNSVDAFANNSNFSTLLENSRDASTNHRYIKTYIPIHPPTAESSQMLIMRYLTTMGEYQEYLGMVFEHNVMQLIFGYIENLNRSDTCLAFEALKYLASLLCHKKFALEFIAHGGLERLLTVPRSSIASTGVSITLYYLSYSEDAMERICTMPKTIIKDLVRYALWILGRSYDSGKCHATMFFGLSFQFKVILEEFDAQDGLRKLYNVISILKILNSSQNEEEENPINEDVECASRQLVRHVCVSLKRYMESHLFFRYNSFVRLQCPSTNGFAQSQTIASKASLDQISEQIRTMQEATCFIKAQWEPVTNLLSLGGITLLLKIISYAYEWNNSGRSETVRSALDVISICCVIPRVFETLYARLELPDNFTTITGITSILGAAAGDITADADVQKSALAVLIHSICAPLSFRSGDVVAMPKHSSSSAKRMKMSQRYPDWLVEKVWDSVCANNGIIVLLSLMQVKTPITDADCIRGMACRALAGLARSERVRQIIGKLPMFASGQIQTLMRDPILQEKRAEHVLFQKYALELLERVSGKTKAINNQLDASLANIHKANVVAQTKIQYNEQQLYQLIHDHLESKGLTQTAQTLKKEANLQVPAQTIKNFHQSPFDYKVLPTSSISRNRLRSRMQDVNMALMNASPSVLTDSNVSLNNSFNNEDLPMSNTNTPIKLVRKVTDKVSTPVSAASVIGPSTSAASYGQRSMQKQITSDINDMEVDNALNPNAGITLSTIVTEYLTNQHALCKNPMSTCPQFDLLTPHKCPDPKPSGINGPNLNITANVFRAQSGYNASRAFRRYIHSNFDCLRTIRSADYSENSFTCCEIVSSSNLILIGLNQGAVKAFNINDGTEQFSAMCHTYLIDTIKSNRVGDMVLTCSSWRAPKSVLWKISNQDFETKLRFNEEHYCEFSNQTQDKVLGTQTDCANIYDLTKGSKISTFKPSFGNQYTKNHATFNPTDEIILSDGVLWDVRSGKEIHKFDKLNNSLSGVFHPNGLEIISNTEVWDLRTFHLLQTVPVLDQCYIAFSPMNVMFGFSLDTDKCNDFEETNTYDTSFKVLDSFDYSSISTIDVKKNINDLSVNANGSVIALVELQPAFDSKEESFVKLYAVGAKRNEQQEEVRAYKENSEDEINGQTTNGRSNDDFVHLYRTTAASGNGGVGVVQGGHAAPRANAAGGRRLLRNIDFNIGGVNGVGNRGAAALNGGVAGGINGAGIGGGGGGGGGGSLFDFRFRNNELRIFNNRIDGLFRSTLNVFRDFAIELNEIHVPARLNRNPAVNRNPNRNIININLNDPNL